MKTGKLLLLAGLLLVAGNSATAQLRFYDQTKTFLENGYAYQCDKSASNRVTLYNVENKYTYERLVFKDGSDANGVIMQGMEPLEDDNWTRQACGFIADDFFSPEERNRLKGKEYELTMIIDSSTGDVIEVNFSFLYTSPFATIPVTTYRKIELDLKERIWFTPTTDGKKMKFIMLSWRQEVNSF